MRNRRSKFLIGGLVSLVIMCIGVTAVFSLFMTHPHRGEAHARWEEHHRQQVDRPQVEEGTNSTEEGAPNASERTYRDHHSRYDGHHGHHRGGSWLPWILLALGAFWFGKRRGRHQHHQPQARPIHEDDEDLPPQKEPEDLI